MSPTYTMLQHDVPQSGVGCHSPYGEPPSATISPIDPVGKQVGRWCAMAYKESARPPPVSGHTTVVIGDKVFQFGGLLSEVTLCSNELWVYSLETQQWSRPPWTGPTPPRVFGHTMVHIRDVIVIYGGKESGNSTSNRVFLLRYLESPMMWEEVTATDGWGAPMGRWGHSALVMEKVPMTQPWGPVHKQKPDVQGILFFGGMTPFGDAVDDLLFFDPTALSWTKLEPQGPLRPAPRRRHTAVQHKNKMYVFGGLTCGHGREFLGDLWALDMHTLQWECLPALKDESCYHHGARTGHVAAVHEDSMWVFGGYAELPDKGKILMSDLHRFDFEQKVWSKVDCTSSSESVPSHDHEHPAAESDGISYMDHLTFQANQRVPPFRRTCTTPHARTMATAFVYNSRLFINGGRDRKTAVACDFFVPLPRRPRTLMDFAAQYIVDHCIPCAGGIPSEVQDLLSGLHTGSMHERRVGEQAMKARGCHPGHHQQHHRHPSTPPTTPQHPSTALRTPSSSSLH
eukprot:CAMPEP_0174284032 /NCGR_PEP_ID=MMETSP0809-20121228/4744_1 /TAXON_ID=73025 ORGANISM="Eutreptiella gymnastica-like, Strain CCMP1594" /NCGR_SAMPLE_ID=MMETSP0809 /ASSEMBLY_ACC=CAM_ASM_000658 /LENGTH=512 /DNA_ID=CAMNT_0015379297 /DNA_START=61 /DNA_END=1599 /DNA_ORIENTATION=+